MASAGSIFVDLLLRDNNYRQGINRARRDTNSFSSNAKRDLGETRRAFADVINPVNNLSSAIRSLGVGIASFLSVQKVVEVSDLYKQLSSRLSLVVTENSQLVAVQDELYQIAIRTRQPLENVYNLYTRLAQAIPESQRGQFNLLEVTESINQALAITGEGSAQAASAVLQFTQAAASGFQASGQEINALLDSAPRLARAIQQSFGDGSRSLKELSEEGLLSTEVIITALQKTSGEGQKLSEEFEKTELTVSQALSNLETSFTKFIGENSFASNSVSTIAQQIQALADIFGELDANINRAIFSLQKFFSYGGDYTVITPEQMRSALPPEYTEYSQGQIQAAIDMAKRMDAELGKLSKDQKKEAEREAKAAQQEFLKNQREIESIYEKNRDLITGIDRETLQYMDTEKELNRLYEERLISYDELYTALQNLDAKYDESAEKVNEFGIDTEEFSKRAAENIQDAFADFLFDPFQDGLDGLLKGFVDVVRRMIAEAQAAQLAKYLFGEVAGGEGGGLLGGVFDSLGGLFGIGSSGSSSGPRLPPPKPSFFAADGGSFGPGRWGVVGEEGPELLYTGNTGATIIPNGGLGGQPIYNIDARGADRGAVARIEQALFALAGPGVIEQRVSNAQIRGAL